MLLIREPPPLLLLPLLGGMLLACPPPQHLAPCTCREGRQAPELRCEGADAAALAEVLGLLELAGTRVAALRIHAARGVGIVSKGFFRGAEGVLSLSARSSNLSELAAASLPLSLLDLDLSGNQLRRVPAAAIAPLDRLAALALDHNLIEALEAHAFAGLGSLLRLSLVGNRIRLVDSRAFLGAEGSLTRLQLGANSLGTLPRYALRRLPRLRSLGLARNDIKEVSVSEHLPPSLMDLDLSGNQIEALEPESFASLQRLSSLDLDRNIIDAVSERAFAGLHESLEWVRLGGNRLKRVPAEALRPLGRLRGLDLRRNRIRTLHADSFIGYGRSLRFIFLQGNSIEGIEDGALDELQSAEWLYLQSNSMKTLRRDTFAAIIDRLQVLDLHDNPYQCDCDILWFRDWLQSKGQNVTNLPKETRCNATREHAHKPIHKLSNSSFACSRAGLSLSGVELIWALQLTLILLLLCR